LPGAPLDSGFRSAPYAGNSAIFTVLPSDTGFDGRMRNLSRSRLMDPAGAAFGQIAHKLESSALTTASPMSVVETGVPPSGPMRSAVRSPSASTFSTAFSSLSASAPWSKE